MRLALLTLLIAILAGPADAADRPNIIFIMSDDHAAHTIGAYGSRVNATPNIDRLAREGMRFDNTFVTNSICTPSRAAILTGYFDTRSFAQIYPWHPAAGDFIARIAGDGVAVRLVAARQYGPLVGPPDLPPEEALLFFFLNLTLRLRVDRLDGVGEVAWAGPDCGGLSLGSGPRRCMAAWLRKRCNNGTLVTRSGAPPQSSNRWRYRSP